MRGHVFIDEFPEQNRIANGLLGKIVSWFFVNEKTKKVKGGSRKNEETRTTNQ